MIYRVNSKKLEKTRKNSIKLEKDFEESDCISRKEVLKLFNRSDCYTWGTALIKKKIEKLPPVTPARKKGKWVIKATGFPPEPMTVCSECGFDRDYYIFPRGCHKLKYCPNCGAEMESKE